MKKTCSDAGLFFAWSNMSGNLKLGEEIFTAG